MRSLTLITALAAMLPGIAAALPPPWENDPIIKPINPIPAEAGAYAYIISDVPSEAVAGEFVTISFEVVMPSDSAGHFPRDYRLGLEFPYGVATVREADGHGPLWENCAESRDIAHDPGRVTGYECELGAALRPNQSRTFSMDVAWPVGDAGAIGSVRMGPAVAAVELLADEGPRLLLSVEPTVHAQSDPTPNIVAPYQRVGWLLSAAYVAVEGTCEGVAPQTVSLEAMLPAAFDLRGAGGHVDGGYTSFDLPVVLKDIPCVEAGVDFIPVSDRVTLYVEGAFTDVGEAALGVVAVGSSTADPAGRISAASMTENLAAVPEDPSVCTIEDPSESDPPASDEEDGPA
jgi:hypothetical protein